MSRPGRSTAEGTARGPGLALCLRAGCTAAASRTADDLAYSVGQQVWICVAGHRTAARRVAEDERPAHVLARFHREVDRVTGATGEVRLSAALGALAERLTTGPDEDELLRAVVAAAAGLVAGGTASAVLVAADSGADLVVASGDDAASAALARLAAGTAPGGGGPDALARAAAGLGLRSVHAAPIRLHGATAGALLLLAARPRAFAPADLAAARALADLAGVGLLLARLRWDPETAVAQLQDALGARVRIEQAKGVLAERDGVPLQDALQVLRSRAAASNRSLLDVADEVVDPRTTRSG